MNRAKEILAYEVVKIVHGEQAAESARQGAQSAFSGAGEGAEDIPTTEIAASRLQAGILIVDLLSEVGLCKSKSEARRMVQQGGARLGDRKVGSIDEKVTDKDLEGDTVLLRAGKKKVHRLKVK